jgi:hypothetical protein
MALPRGASESNKNGHFLKCLGNSPFIELQGISGSFPKRKTIRTPPHQLRVARRGGGRGKAQ